MFCLSWNSSWGAWAGTIPYFLIPKNISAFRLPTDLLGITAATYEANRVDGNLKAALASACNQILREIQRKSAAERSNYLGGEWIQEARIGSRIENKSKAL